MSFNSRGNFASGTPQGSVDITHTFPVEYNTTGISSGVKVGTIIASTDKPVEVEVFYQVVTAFNAATTNVLTAGTSTTATEWIGATGVNERVTGFYPVASAGKFLTFTGSNGAGAITLTGAAVGDNVVSLNGVTATAAGSAAASFESAITVANQIQQSSASDLSAKAYIVQLSGAGTANRFRLTANTDVYAKYTQSGTAATTGSALLIVREYSVSTNPIA